MKKLIKLLLLIAINFSFAYSQDVIELTNPSFEDWARCCKPPSGWFSCGDSKLNTPDVQPGAFYVVLPAMEGKTYLGMVTRNVDSWESIFQDLSSPMQKDTTYVFSIYLAKSETLVSQDRLTKKDVNYNTPTLLRIWGENSECENGELLVSSPLIDHDYWKKYDFVFTPSENWNILRLEAYYETDNKPYNGNLLLDNCSGIVKINVKDLYDEHTKEEDFFNMILTYSKSKSASQSDFANSKINTIQQVWKFNIDANKKGIRQYVFNHSPNEIEAISKYLKEVDAIETATVLDSISQIYHKDQNDLKEAEITYFKNSESLFVETTEIDNIKGLLLLYIQKNKNEISKAFSAD